MARASVCFLRIIAVCSGGEIGRHASLRGWWPFIGRGGSSPLLSTMSKAPFWLAYFYRYWLLGANFFAFSDIEGQM